MCIRDRIYTCVDKLAYFPTLATYSCLYPLSGKLLEELGTEGYKAVTWETLWYNGPYTITTVSYTHLHDGLHDGGHSRRQGPGKN